LDKNFQIKPLKAYYIIDNEANIGINVSLNESSYKCLNNNKSYVVENITRISKY